MVHVHIGDTLYCVNFEKSDEIQELVAIDTMMCKDGSMIVWFNDTYIKSTQICERNDGYEYGFISPSTGGIYPDMCFTYHELDRYLSGKVESAEKAIQKYRGYSEKLGKLEFGE